MIFENIQACLRWSNPERFRDLYSLDIGGIRTKFRNELDDLYVRSNPRREHPLPDHLRSHVYNSWWTILFTCNDHVLDSLHRTIISDLSRQNAHRRDCMALYSRNAHSGWQCLVFRFCLDFFILIWYNTIHEFRNLRHWLHGYQQTLCRPSG